MIKFDMQETTADIAYKKLSEQISATFLYCGDVYLQFHEKEVNSSMIVSYDEKRGYYLRFYADETKRSEVLLSLWDENKLEKVIEYDVDCLASEGLFVPIEKALPEIQSFLQNGIVSDKITWCKPERIPDDGNW